MSNESGIKHDDGGIAKIGAAVVGIAKGFMDPLKDHFDAKATREAEDANKNLSAAQHGSNNLHFETVSKLMEQSNTHDIVKMRESGKQARSMVRATAKVAGESKPGTKKMVQSSADGSLAVNHTTASAPRKPKAAATKPTVAKAAGARASARAKASPANPSRGGKK